MAIDWPEAQWERARPHVRITLAEAADLVAPLGHAFELELLAGGKANTNYRVRMRERDDLVLRIYERAPGLCAREAALLEGLDPDIPAPTPLLDGRLASGQPVALLPFVAGVHPWRIMDESTAPALGRACGKTLALLALHHPAEVAGLYADDLSLARRFDSIGHAFTDLIEWSLRKGRARRRLPPELRASLRERVELLARALEPLDAHLCLTHGDYKLSNILVQPRGTGFVVSGLLDWEFAGPFTPLLDVAILLRHEAHFPPSFAEGFARAYREAGAWLPTSWRRLAKLVDLMNMVGFLNGTSSRPQLEAQAIEQIAATLAAERSN